ncbi:MAG: DUF2400 family protein [Flavobacteriales bacterium AspAUS03]
MYQKHGGLEDLFTIDPKKATPREGVIRFRKIFSPSPMKNVPRSTSPILRKAPPPNTCAYMFLRWMVRKDRTGVDLGLWKNILHPKLFCPLDTHSGRVARKLGLLSRRQNDIKAVMVLDQNIRSFDQKDPVKYYFTLFTLGVFENF